MRLLFLSITMTIVLVSPATSWAIPSCGTELQRGIASWYGPGFEGRLTQSEEFFDPQGYSAAHPSLPFGSLIKVTNLKNSRSVVVKVNDRGGFKGRRIIDLSHAAAAQIDMIEEGTAPVSIQVCK
jgi:rare lipoprotein A